jgi:RNA polymerase primary sigma factor
MCKDFRQIGGVGAGEPISLQTLTGDGEDSHLGDLVENKAAVIRLDAAIQANLREATTRVLHMRFGIGTHTGHTLEEDGRRST